MLDPGVRGRHPVRERRREQCRLRIIIPDLWGLGIILSQTRAGNPLRPYVSRWPRLVFDREPAMIGIVREPQQWQGTGAVLPTRRLKLYPGRLLGVPPTGERITDLLELGLAQVNDRPKERILATLLELHAGATPWAS
jgi:hypothetical protein